MKFWVVTLTATLLALTVSASEWLTQRVSENPFFCAILGVSMANMVAQIGVTPLQLLPQIAMNFAVIGSVSLVQAYWFRRGWFAIRRF